MMLPRYPVYVISKGRYELCRTARFLVQDGVPFHLVVEPQEFDQYAARFGDRVVALPFSNLGQGSIPARNWCWEHSKANGFERHWILDDNIMRMRRWHKKRYPVNAGPALRILEDFTDRYENVAITGMAYDFMCRFPKIPPFYQNVHVYSCLLILNSIPNRWRGRYNEDTDLCLQVLSDGWCTILSNVFLIEKMATMTVKGGNTAELYQGDGRLRMARSLERQWPGVVTVVRRWNRPQHKIKFEWRKFDTPLKRKPGIDLSKLPAIDDMGLVLTDAPQETLSAKAKTAAAKKHAHS